VSEGTAKPIQPPDNEDVSCSQVAKCRCQAFALGFGTGDLIGEDLLTAGLLKGISLHVEGLVMG
jgi:hypothetical protein